jgi:hypothetical protein
MEKPVDLSHAEAATPPAPESIKGKSALIRDNNFEHEQTVLQVIRSHPVLIWWAFFFSVSAIGWYVP